MVAFSALLALSCRISSPTAVICALISSPDISSFVRKEATGRGEGRDGKSPKRDVFSFKDDSNHREYQLLPMADLVRQIGTLLVDALQAVELPPVLPSTRFVLNLKDEGTWVLDVVAKTFTQVASIEVDTAAPTVTVDSGTLHSLVTGTPAVAHRHEPALAFIPIGVGRLSPARALVSGKIKFRGDRAALAVFRPVFAAAGKYVKREVVENVTYGERPFSDGRAYKANRSQLSAVVGSPFSMSDGASSGAVYSPSARPVRHSIEWMPDEASDVRQSHSPAHAPPQRHARVGEPPESSLSGQRFRESKLCRSIQPNCVRKWSSISMQVCVLCRRPWMTFRRKHHCRRDLIDSHSKRIGLRHRIPRRTAHGIPPGMVSHPAWYPTRYGIQAGRRDLCSAWLWSGAGTVAHSCATDARLSRCRHSDACPRR